jgi:hypothetical protein
MCITLAIAAASLLIAGASTYATIQGNNAQADYAKFQAKAQTKELQVNNELMKISSLEKENERGREFSRQWGASMAAIGASGVAEHISFFQGIAPDNMDRFQDEVRAIRLNLVSETDRNTRQIGVVRYGAQVAGFNAKVANFGAIADFMQSAMSAATFYNSYKVPGKGPTPSAGGGMSQSFSSSMGEFMPGYKPPFGGGG